MPRTQPRRIDRLAHDVVLSLWGSFACGPAIDGARRVSRRPRRRAGGGLPFTPLSCCSRCFAYAVGWSRFAPEGSGAGTRTVRSGCVRLQKLAGGVAWGLLFRPPDPAVGDDASCGSGGDSATTSSSEVFCHVRRFLHSTCSDLRARRLPRSGGGRVVSSVGARYRPGNFTLARSSGVPSRPRWSR